MIVSIDTGKTFNKSQHPFVVKNKKLSQLRREGTFTKPHSSRGGEECTPFFKIEAKTRMSTLLHIVLDAVASAIQQEK